jgi:CDP-diacylglycerol--glycerol-3-phosphate 3-phosphatidyltransferase
VAKTTPTTERGGGISLSLYVLKPAFQMLLQPHVGRLARAGVTANQVTLAAAIGSIAVGALVAALLPMRWPFLLIPIWLFIRMALNAADGMLARDHGQKTRLGAYLNEIGDVVSDVALYAVFGRIAAFGPHLIAIVLLLAVLTEFVGVLGPTVGAQRRYDGPMGKSDRALVFGALAAWYGFGGPLPGWTMWIMIVVAVLLVVTCVRRVRGGLQQGKVKP